MAIPPDEELLSEMTPIKHDITIYQGATFRETMTWQTGVPPATTTAVDLTGCTLRMQIREKVSSPNYLISLTSRENGGITVTPELGQFEILMTQAQTSSITSRRAVYDLEIEFSNGDVIRFLQGIVTISQEVTR